MEKLTRDLLVEFDEERGFYETVYDQFYATVAASFKDEVEEYCKVVIFGYEYALGVREVYEYDRDLAIVKWRDYVGRSLDDFRGWAKQSIENFAGEFQQWLAEQDDEWASGVIVALMSGEIDLTEIIVDWICYRLGYEAWEYPA